MALLTLADAKEQLDIDTDAHNAELQAYIDAVTPVIERLTGPVENRTVTEQVSGRGNLLALNQVPVVSLTSLTPVLNGGTAIDAGDVTVDGESGIIRRLDGGFFAGGPWIAVYVAGRGENVPATINLAARLLVQHLWRTQYGSARSSQGADDYHVQEPTKGWAYAMPNRVLELLEPYRTPPGVA